MKYAFAFVGLIALFLWCMTAGIAWAWKMGQKWGRLEEDKRG